VPGVPSLDDLADCVSRKTGLPRELLLSEIKSAREELPILSDIGAARIVALSHGLSRAEFEECLGGG
jgi:hypothetical protein